LKRSFPPPPYTVIGNELPFERKPWGDRDHVDVVRPARQPEALRGVARRKRAPRFGSAPKTCPIWKKSSPAPPSSVVIAPVVVAVEGVVSRPMS